MNKIQVVNKNLHENKNEMLLGYDGEFEKVASLKVDDQVRQTLIRFKNSTNYEAYINSIDVGFDAEDAVFIG